MATPGVEAALVLKELESLAERVRALVLKQPELRDPVSFAVWPEESDPHEAGPLYVKMDQNGVRLWWLGTEREGEPEADISWTALRRFHQVENEIERSEALRDDLLSEVEMYRRLAYRYRNAAASMRRKYEEYVETLPPAVPRVAVER